MPGWVGRGTHLSETQDRRLTRHLDRCAESAASSDLHRPGAGSAGPGQYDVEDPGCARRCDDMERSAEERRSESGGRTLTVAAVGRPTDARARQTAAARAGYSWSFSLPQGPEEVTNHALPRVGIFRDNGPMRFRAKLSERYLKARTSPLFQRLTRR